MTTYLTPDRFRTMGFGVDLDDLGDDVQLRSILYSASRTVDSYCAVPRLPVPFSFRGGVVTDQNYRWDPGDQFTPMQRTFMLSHRPVKSVEAMRIYISNDQYTTFSPTTELWVTPLGIIEIVSLAVSPYGLFGGGVIPGLYGLTRPVAKISYTYGYDFPVVDEVLEPTDGRTFTAQNQFWTDDVPEVKVDGTVVSGYTVDREEGAIVFTDTQTATAVVTASYTYTVPSEVAQATGLIAANEIVNRSLLSKGMGNLLSLRVGEIEMRRDLPRVTQGSREAAAMVPPPAAQKLTPYVFVTLR